MNPFEYLYPEFGENVRKNPFRLVRLPENIPGKLFLGRLPCRDSTREKFETWISDNNIEQIVCLLSDDDIKKFSPDYLELISQEGNKFQALKFPVPDHGVPVDRRAYFAFAEKIAENLSKGRNTFVHCHAGVGRSGCFGIVILMILGLSQSDAERRIIDAGGFAENEAQRGLIQWCTPNRILSSSE